MSETSTRAARVPSFGEVSLCSCSRTAPLLNHPPAPALHLPTSALPHLQHACSPPSARLSLGARSSSLLSMPLPAHASTQRSIPVFPSPCQLPSLTLRHPLMQPQR